MNVEFLIVCQLIINVIREIILNIKAYLCYHVLRKCYPSMFCTNEPHT